MFAEAKHRYRSGLPETMKVLTVSSALHVTLDGWDGRCRLPRPQSMSGREGVVGQLGVPRKRSDEEIMST